MSSPVSISELRDTVTRMEERFRERGDTLTIRLMRAYDELIPRFRSDLNERDELLSRGGALMLIQEVAEAET